MPRQGIHVSILQYLHDCEQDPKQVDPTRLLGLEPDRAYLIEDFTARANYYATRDPMLWNLYDTLAERLTTSNN